MDNGGCDCGAAKARTTHIWWCSTQILKQVSKSKADAFMAKYQGCTFDTVSDLAPHLVEVNDDGPSWIKVEAFEAYFEGIDPDFNMREMDHGNLYCIMKGDGKSYYEEVY